MRDFKDSIYVINDFSPEIKWKVIYKKIGNLLLNIHLLKKEKILKTKEESSSKKSKKIEFIVLKFLENISLKIQF